MSSYSFNGNARGIRFSLALLGCVCALVTNSACQTEEPQETEGVLGTPCVMGVVCTDGSECYKGFCVPADGPDTTDPDATGPEPDATGPEPDATEPEPDATEPEPDATEPEPDATEPEPDATGPEPDATGPDPDATEPEPDATEPDAATTGCEDDSACDDADPCNGLETCGDDGACQVGQPVVCDDGDPCNGLETCGDDGACQVGQPVVCDDGDPCNGVETCGDDGACQDGQPVVCDDANDCTADTCDAETGQCVNEDNGECALYCEPILNDTDPQLAPYKEFTCSTGTCWESKQLCVECDLSLGPEAADQDCGEDEICHGFQCLPGLACASDTVCKTTDQLCATSGEHPGHCVDCLEDSHCEGGESCFKQVCSPDLTACGSSLDCPGLEVCHDGLCMGCGTDADCLDGDYCDWSLYEATLEAPSCKAQVCAPGELSCVGNFIRVCDDNGSSFSSVSLCDDGLGCTEDTCSAEGCVYTDICPDDGNACNGTESCTPEGCVLTPGPSCDDGNECTTDGCIPETGECTTADKPDGTECPTAPCEVGLAFCESGSCSVQAKDCDDQDICTADNIDCLGPDGNPSPCCKDPVGGENSCKLALQNGVTCHCRHIPNYGALCDDGNPCTTDTACFAGEAEDLFGDKVAICTATAFTDCNDDKPLTKDSCDALTGDCKHEWIDCSMDNGGCSHLCAFDEGTGVTCGCPEGYELWDLFSCKQTDPCTADGNIPVCSFNGVLAGACKSEGNTYTCDCDEGFLFSDGSCVPVICTPGATYCRYEEGLMVLVTCGPDGLGPDGEPPVDCAAQEQVCQIDACVDLDEAAIDCGVAGCTHFYQDNDVDGIGGEAHKCLCGPEGKYTAIESGDCDDNDPSVWPGNIENCATAKDENCSGSTKDLGALGCSNYYFDGDDDGYGVGDPMCLCGPSDPYDATSMGDCHGADDQINPGAPEKCNGFDDNCNGTVDTAEASGTGLCGSPGAGGASGCNEGACFVVECPPGYADADGLFENGCEKPVGP